MPGTYNRSNIGIKLENIESDIENHQRLAIADLIYLAYDSSMNLREAEIGRAIARIRRRLGMSQTSAASRATAGGFSIQQPAISVMERAEVMPSVAKLDAYLRAIGSSLGDLARELDPAVADPLDLEVALLRREAEAAPGGLAELNLLRRISDQIEEQGERIDELRDLLAR
jgi:transcriptional regulator with XRE-family HTH domain